MKIFWMRGGGIGKLSSFVECKKLDLIDINEKAVEFVKQLNKYRECSVGSIANIKKGNRYYDKVCCIETLHYIRDWKVAIDELFRITKKRLIITAPNFWALRILYFWKYNHHSYLKINELLRYIKSKERNFVTRTYYSANRFRIIRRRLLSSELVFVIDFKDA